ncbi:hypothetical protein GCM10025876_35660 [Demequina litorisediminis]|uniref:Fe-S cluster assembly protein SufD n=1 Tax=Demequina litorisediminis TaxID=1849022 RepID=A0ABQ6IHF7_9MICO|nr:hypothetical protein GCM10025876_35660 [Demequina litorisediminis]
MTVTDHSRATADAAHTHGLGTPTPDASRADRPTSFEVDSFTVPTGREEEWRFSPTKALAPVFVDEAVDGHLEWDVPELPAGVTLTEVSTADARERSVRAPGDRAAAVAAAHAGGAMALTIAPNTVVDEPIQITLTGTGADVRGHLLVEAGASSEATVIIERKGTATYSEFVSVDLAQNASLNLVLLQAVGRGRRPRR